MKTGTQLDGRILWFDGDSSYDINKLYEVVLSGKLLDSTVFVNKITKDVRSFNDLNPKLALGEKEEIRHVTPEWNIPESYKSLNVTKYLRTKLVEELDKRPNFSVEDIDARIIRVEEELALYDEFDLVEVLRVMVYVVDKFRENSVVWGTGRGSSCCSYCLYLIGVHDVDSVKYELDLSEFFR